MVTRADMHRDDRENNNSTQLQQQQQQQQQTDENSSPPLLGLHSGGMVVPTDSEHPRVGSKKKHPSCGNNKRQGNSPAGFFGDRSVEPLIVFDWDDTILTSSWIQVNDLLQAGSYEDLPLENRRDLAQLEESVVKCLKNARRLGTVIIITNAESGWVELSAARFFANVLPLLEGVPVISARSLFESQFPGSPLCWKSAAFAYMMHDHFLDRPQWMQKKVVSIGDSNEEKVAMRIASGQHGTMAAKAIKFITGPDPEALSCQLDFVTEHLAAVVSSDSDVDIILDASMIHGSYSLPLHSRGVYEDQQQQQQSVVTAAATSARTSSSSSSSPFRASRDPSRAAGASAALPSHSSPSHGVARASAVAAPAYAVSGSSGSTRETTTATVSRGRSSSSSRGGEGAATPATKSSSPRLSPSSPSPAYPGKHVALKRRASSSPIPIPSAAGQDHGGHGRGPGVESIGAGGVGRGDEGGGDCVQPFPPSRGEVGAGGTSYSSPSQSLFGSALTPPSSSPANSIKSRSSSSSDRGDGDAIVTPSSTSFGAGCARGGSGGGYPCPVDHNGGVGSDVVVRMIKEVVVVNMGENVASEVVPGAAEDQGVRGKTGVSAAPKAGPE